MSSETVCFACGRSSGSISRPTYAKEIELFKKFVLDLGPSYKRKHELGDTVVAEFGASSHLCATCLSSVVAVWRMQEKIVSIQKEINCIVRKVRNHLEIKTEEREGVVEEGKNFFNFMSPEKGKPDIIVPLSSNAAKARSEEDSKVVKLHSSTELEYLTYPALDYGNQVVLRKRL
ncbi:hypothetical protein Fcan01_23286 [Folsomia candida]|uniref:Uncharacterized protein n=1 Tax=Folsomia candida TaxID=158441 RepID=A0A226DB46_FOLCA|nr:hypothetical protein Fcan01_23286 [Folsomia candida]